MTASAYKDIRAALAVQLQTIQSGGSPPIAWENSGYSPVVGTLYLAEFHLPGSKRNVGLEDDSTDDYEGIYQVSVRSAADDHQERFVVETQAAAVEALFVRGSTYTQNSKTVRIRRTEIGPGLFDDGWFQINVDVHYRALT